MLDIALRDVSFAYRQSRFALRNINLLIAKSTHTAIVGPAGAGASTLLGLVAGLLRPDSGDVIIGSRVVNRIRPSGRPLLYVTSALDVPNRWSVQHALVAAVRQRTLDRIDRQQEYELAVSKWSLDPDRKIGTLSPSQRTLVHLARIELLKPGILVADRLLEHLNPSEVSEIADRFHRTLRVMGATVLSAPANFAEQGLTDSIAVLDDGRLVQEGTAAQVFSHPVSEAAARATGDVSIVPITVRGDEVASVIGPWSLPAPPFQGTGVAMIRPDAFQIAQKGEESDVIVSIEEAAFVSGHWLVTGLLSGAVRLRFLLDGNASVHKGKLLPLRYDPQRFTLIPRETEPLQSSVPVDAVPSLRDSR